MEVMECRICGEEVYVHMYAQHLYKDHDEESQNPYVVAARESKLPARDKSGAVHA